VANWNLMEKHERLFYLLHRMVGLVRSVVDDCPQSWWQRKRALAVAWSMDNCSSNRGAVVELRWHRMHVRLVEPWRLWNWMSMQLRV